MSEDKKTAIELTAIDRLMAMRIRKGDHKGDTVKGAIIELAKRMDEIQNELRPLRGTYPDIPPAKPEPDAEWPGGDFTKLFHMGRISDFGKSIKISMLNPDDSYRNDYINKSDIPELISFLNYAAHGHDQEGGE